MRWESASALTLEGLVAALFGPQSRGGTGQWAAGSRQVGPNTEFLTPPVADSAAHDAPPRARRRGQNHAITDTMPHAGC